MANNSMDTIAEDEETSGPMPSMPSGDVREQLMKIRKQKKKLAADQSDDDGSDTDLELEEEKKDFDVSGKTHYLNVCRLLNIVPASYFIRHMNDETLRLGHHGLGIQGVRALSYPLENNTNVINLEIQDNWLEGEGGEYIAEMLNENCYIASLDISNNKLGTRGCEAICKMLHNNTTLKELNLSGNELVDNDATPFVEALIENNVLRSLNLSHNNFGEKAGPLLAKALGENESIEELDLSWNNFRLKSGIVLCDGIAVRIYGKQPCADPEKGTGSGNIFIGINAFHRGPYGPPLKSNWTQNASRGGNTRLKEVNLAMNGLGNEGAFAIAEIIKTSPSITHLNVTHNRIGYPGAQAIGKALEGNEVLKVFLIGPNPIGLEGLKLVFAGVCADRNAVVELDFSGIEVDKEFRAMKEELQEKRKINIIHGKVMSDYVIVGKPKKAKIFDTPMTEVTPSNIMVVIKTYCDVTGISLYDSLAYHDINKEKKVTWSEFLASFQESGVELSQDQAEALEGLIVEYRTADDKIDYSTLR